MNQQDSAQVTRLRAIGAQLAQERQAQALSIEEISTRTYISPRLLRAIEAGELRLLPEPVFVQGFIRRYADLLGLDGLALSKSFPISSVYDTPTPASIQPISRPTPDPISDLPPEPIAEAAPPPPPLPPTNPVREGRSRPQAPVSQGRRSYLPFVIGGLALVGLGIGVVAGLNHGQQNQVNQPPTDPPESSNQANLPPLPQESPTTSPSPIASPSPSPITGVEVKVDLVADCWMTVTIDGKSAFDGMLRKGESRTWAGKKQVTLVAGNAGGASVSVNQEPAKLMGAPGEVKEVSFPANNL